MKESRLFAPLAGLSRSWWVFLKEANSFFGSSLPPLTIGIVAFMCGLVSVALANSQGATYEEITRFLFYIFYIIIMVAAVFLSMSAFVNERKQGTLELLYTLPVSDLELVLGKFFIGILFVTVLSVSMTVVYIVGIAEAPAYIAFSGILGLILVGLYAFSAGIFASSLTDSYLISLFTVTLALVIIDIGGFLAGLLPSPARGILSHMHALNQYTPFTRGILPLKGFVFFGSLIVFFLFLAVKALESRRWRG